jgi:uncharacterized protein
MDTKIFVNLPIKDVARSRKFYTGIGYTINEHFSNEQAFCVVINESIYVMLLIESYFKTFTNKEIIDAHKSIECLNALSVSSRDEVDALVKKAVESGGRTPVPARDLGFMYQHSFQDPDGHVWEVFWMDPSAVPEG